MVENGSINVSFFYPIKDSKHQFHLSVYFLTIKTFYRIFIQTRWMRVNHLTLEECGQMDGADV